MNKIGLLVSSVWIAACTIGPGEGSGPQMGVDDSTGESGETTPGSADSDPDSGTDGGPVTPDPPETSTGSTSSDSSSSEDGVDPTDPTDPTETTGICVGESDQELCGLNDVGCGAIDVVDSCGEARAIECGGCEAPDSCGGAGVDNACGCAPETDQELCAAANGCELGDFVDRCGAQRSVDCGACDWNVSPVCDNGACECAVTPDVTDLQCQSNAVYELDFTFNGQSELYTYVTAHSQAELPANCIGGVSVPLLGNVGYNDHDVIGTPFPDGPCWWYRICAHHPGCTQSASPGRDVLVCPMLDNTYSCMIPPA